MFLNIRFKDKYARNWRAEDSSTCNVCAAYILYNGGV